MQLIGFRVLPRAQAVSPELVARSRTLPVANLSDAMARTVAGGARLRPMHLGRVMAGPALTVKARPGDNLMIHKALMMAQPGDVIVVDAGGDLTNALIGEIMVAEAVSRGVEGMVINGAIRDSQAIGAGDFPVFAVGVTHRGPYKDGPGEINVPVAIDGMVIQPGDLLIGDRDGLLAIPCHEVEAVCAAAAKKHAVEEQSLVDIRNGVPRDKSWVDRTLERLGCEIRS
jgi:RraA family protein